MGSTQPRVRWTVRFVATGVLAIAASGLVACGSSDEFVGDAIVNADQDGLLVTPRGEDDSAQADDSSTDATASVDAAGNDTGKSEASDQGSIAEVDFTWWDGQPATGADLIGQPTVINFFASSCPPCVNELPDFESVSHQFEGQVRFVGIAAGDEREAAQQLLDDTGVTFEIGDDPENDMFVSMGGFVLPTTYFVDEHGTIVDSQLGAMTAEMLETAITTNFPEAAT